MLTSCITSPIPSSFCTPAVMVFSESCGLSLLTSQNVRWSVVLPTPSAYVAITKLGVDDQDALA